MRTKLIRGYIRKDGTVVKPHLRTTPDKHTWNNLKHVLSFAMVVLITRLGNVKRGVFFAIMMVLSMPRSF